MVAKETGAQAVRQHDFMAGLGEQLAELSVSAVELTDGSHVEVSAVEGHLLANLLKAFRSGGSTSGWLDNTVIGTQEAASLLGVSRPTVVKLLEQGKIPFHKVNAYRKVFLSDVLAYRDSMAQRHQAVAVAEHTNLMEGAEPSQDWKDDAARFASGEIDADELLRLTKERHDLA